MLEIFLTKLIPMEIHVLWQIFSSPPPPLNTTLTTHVIYGRPCMGFSAGYIQYISMGNFFNLRNICVAYQLVVFLHWRTYNRNSVSHNKWGVLYNEAFRSIFMRSFPLRHCAHHSSPEFLCLPGNRSHSLSSRVIFLTLVCFSSRVLVGWGFT